MMNWDDFEHIHVIRKLREILSKWWHTEIFFADDRGFIRGIDREKDHEYKNLICNLILQTDTGFDVLSNFAKTAVAKMKQSDERFLLLDCDFGFAGLIVPIFIEREFMGVVF